MNTQLSSIIKWGGLVYLMVFLPKLIVFDNEGESAPIAITQAPPLRVGILVTGAEHDPLLDKDCCPTLEKYIVALEDEAVMSENTSAKNQAHQLEKILASERLQDLDVLFCDIDEVPTLALSSQENTHS